MSDQTLNIETLQLKHGAESEWNKIEQIYTPRVGEPIIYDPDMNHAYPRMKIGDGKTCLKDLPFIQNSVDNDIEKSLGTSVVGAINKLLQKNTDLNTKHDNFVNNTYEPKLEAVDNSISNLSKGIENNLDALTTHNTSTDAHSSIRNAIKNGKLSIKQNGKLIKEFTANSEANVEADITEEDPTVPTHVKGITAENIESWNNKSNFDGDYNSLTNKPTIPDELKDLTADPDHRTVTDTEKNTWNAKSNFSGNYDELTNKPPIPTKVSEIASAGSGISINEKTISNTGVLSLGGATGEIKFAQTGGASVTVDANTKTITIGAPSSPGGPSAAEVETKLNTHTGNTDIHVTAAEKTAWNSTKNDLEELQDDILKEVTTNYAAIGEGINRQGKNVLVCGKYNNTDNSGESLFVVGGGTATTKKNLFEVTPSGITLDEGKHTLTPDTLAELVENSETYNFSIQNTNFPCTLALNRLTGYNFAIQLSSTGKEIILGYSSDGQTINKVGQTVNIGFKASWLDVSYTGSSSSQTETVKLGKIYMFWDIDKTVPVTISPEQGSAETTFNVLTTDGWKPQIVTARTSEPKVTFSGTYVTLWDGSNEIKRIDMHYDIAYMIINDLKFTDETILSAGETNTIRVIAKNLLPFYVTINTLEDGPKQLKVECTNQLDSLPMLHITEDADVMTGIIEVGVYSGERGDGPKFTVDSSDPTKTLRIPNANFDDTIKGGLGEDGQVAFPVGSYVFMCGANPLVSDLGKYGRMFLAGPWDVIQGEET